MPDDIILLRDILDSTKNVEGWLSPLEGILLWNLGRLGAGRGELVEIGSWKGKSTIWLASGSKSAMRERVVSVDPHTGSDEHHKMYGQVWTYDEFLRNLKSSTVDDWVVPIIGLSREVAKQWNGDVRLVFIDGSHSYVDARDDFLTWFDLLSDNGLIALHDSFLAGWEGPMKVVERFILQNNSVAHVGFVGSITFCQKVKRSKFQYARSTLLLLSLRLFDRIATLRRRKLALWISLLLDATDVRLIGMIWRVHRQWARLRASAKTLQGK